MTVESVFPVPFSVELPSTIAAARTTRVGVRTASTPGYASFVYVAGADNTPAYLTLYIPAGVFRDPCHPEEGMLTTSAEPGVDELVEALTSQVGVRAGPVTDIVFGDYRGKVFDLDNNIDERTCTDNPWLPQWTFRSEGLDSDVVEKSGGLTNSSPADRDRGCRWHPRAHRSLGAERQTRLGGRDVPALRIGAIRVGVGGAHTRLQRPFGRPWWRRHPAGLA